MYKDFNENDIDKSFISYQNIFTAKFLGREAIWNDISKGLFTVQSRVERRRERSDSISL